MLILDEVMCGFGAHRPLVRVRRATTSSPTSSPSPRASTPATCPVGGVIITDAIAATFDDRVFPGGLTYSGHPLAMASIVASLDAMDDEGIVENARRDRRRRASARASPTLAERHPLIGEVRGEGVFWALELVADPRHARTRRRRVMGRLKAELLARGLLPFIADNRIHVVPPCVVTADEVAEALAIYDEALTAVEA